MWVSGKETSSDVVTFAQWFTHLGVRRQIEDVVYNIEYSTGLGQTTIGNRFSPMFYSEELGIIIIDLNYNPIGSRMTLQELNDNNAITMIQTMCVMRIDVGYCSMGSSWEFYLKSQSGGSRILMNLSLLISLFMSCLMK